MSDEKDIANQLDSIKTMLDYRLGRISAHLSDIVLLQERMAYAVERFVDLIIAESAGMQRATAGIVSEGKVASRNERGNENE